MVQFEKWKIWMVVAIIVGCIIVSLPNLFSPERLQSMPSWFPKNQVNLGLDLQGGSHLLLEVDLNALEAEHLETLVDSVRVALRRAQIGYTNLAAKGGAVSVEIRDPAQVETARALIEQAANGLDITVNGPVITLKYNQATLDQLRSHAVDQSVEIVRRRIDEFGTKEPIIARQGADRILVQVPGDKDPDRLKKALGTVAKLTFRFVEENVSPQDAQAGRLPAGTEALPGERGGSEVVQKRVMVSGENLVDAQATFQNNQPVVSFRFDSVGARRFGDATRENVGRRFAIVLDNKVISAPVIREPILGGSGIISGSFTVESAQDLALLLRAGALPAPLNILEQRSVGPGLGADSIRAGKIACALGAVLVMGFMIAAYGLFGLFADLALVVNILIIIAAMSLLQSTLTLPGIAGIVLTMGVAVDANVLIYERIREEARASRGPVTAIDAGFRRALATIIDTHLTTVIAAVLLFQFGSGPVRGFAVTLTIGIISSLFTAFMLTRLMVVMWLRKRRPSVVPV
jgi:protein-export membrane protein SecD